MSLLIHGGSLVLETGVERADLLCEDGRIAAILEPGHHVAHDEELDVTGQLVFPGFIDPHVHSRDPGDTHKETFHHSTLGALCGGLTTILEMPNAVPAVSTVEVFHERKAHHEQSAWVDFGLWGLALGPQNNAELPGLFEAGAVAVKLFWGYALDKQTKGLVYNFEAADPDEIILPPENGEVLELFQAVADAGGVLGVHCEDRHVLAASAAALGHPIETYEDLLRARPAAAESAAIALGAEFARLTGCTFHVVHMASKEGARVVRDARGAGIPITAETCPQYLTLTDADAERLGPLIKIYPPVKHQDDQDAMWEGLRDGSIELVASDHAPHPAAEKLAGFGQAPAGGLGVETIAPLMVDGFVEGRLDAVQLANVLSVNTARKFGIHPRKGSLRVGSDADVSIVDPNGSTSIRNETLHALEPVSTWDGRDLKGRITASVIRGSVAMRDGEPVGERRGQFVAASHRPPVR